MAVMERPLHVLVVEDDPIDFKLLKRTLRDTPNFVLVWETTLAQGVSRIANERFDVVLLDLSLPDSDGLNTISAFTQEVSTPVVILSNMHDESTALKSVQQGAQDYLFKDQMDSALLSRTLRYAIERYGLLEELHDIRQMSRRKLELRRLQTGANLESGPSSPREKPRGLLKTENPAVFKEVMKTYGELISHSLERREYQVRPMNLSKRLKELAETLGNNSASPRDVTQMHTLCVENKLDNLPPQKNGLCHQEARYLLSGLLGHLCYFYMEQADAPHQMNTPDE